MKTITTQEAQPTKKLVLNKETVRALVKRMEIHGQANSTSCGTQTTCNCNGSLDRCRY